MMPRLLPVAVVLAALSVVACKRAPEPVQVLSPDPNPMPETDPLWSPQPHRDRPRALCVSGDGKKAWVMLAGTEDAPGKDVAVVDLSAARVLKRVTLPAAPWNCAVHPSGKWLVVTLRYADHAIVLDASTDEEIARVPTPYYTEVPAFTPDGRRLYLSNRWKDSVFWWELGPGPDFRLISRSDEGIPSEDPVGTPVAENPTSLLITPDGTRLFAGAATAAATSVLDARTGALLDVDGDPTTTTVGAPQGVTYLNFHSPVGGLASWGNYLFIADIGGGMGEEPTAGLDLDEDGQPGDGTANVVFQDLQNEIGVVDVRTLKQVHRYTTDVICCKDYRDVDPDQPNRGLLIPAPDTWKPEVVQYLPPRETWIIGGALPEGMTVVGNTLWVAYAGSNEVQGFAIAEDGSLTPLQTQQTGGLYKTGYNPKAIAGFQGKLVTVNQLGESLTIIDPTQPPGHERTFIIGDVSGGPFPSTDAELGEGINEMTAPFSIDGRQTCVHCHRDNGAIARPIVMPLQLDRLHSCRNVMAQRGLYDTRPWFVESSMDETNFFPVLNEFARKENFCCEELDATVWSHYPTLDACTANPSLDGCKHVLNCTVDPPPECAARPYAQTPFLTRAEFIKDGARRLFGRDTMFGDVLYHAKADGSHEPLAIDFDGMTRALGLFMLRTPRLLPNPNRPLNLPTAQRGAELFQDAGVGCVHCHPLPATTTASAPDLFSPFGMPVRFPPVISPERGAMGSDAEQVNIGFIKLFPQTLQDSAGLHVGATPLRGLWDRPHTRFLHDGRARSLREVLATPGHEALLPGEVGRNERDGVFDTHGGTSQLDKYQLEDLINYLHTL